MSPNEAYVQQIVAECCAGVPTSRVLQWLGDRACGR